MAYTREITLHSGLSVKPASGNVVAPVNDDVFSDFTLPSLIRPIIRKNNSLLLPLLCTVSELGSIVEKLKTNQLTFVVPVELRSAIRDGVAYLGKSNIHSGSMAPNIYDSGSGKLIGQGYVTEGWNPANVGDALNNVAIYAMLQNVIGKLDSIQKDVSFIKEGQQDDRMGKVIGSFKSYAIALPTFRTTEEQRNASFIVYCSISEGLYQIHFFLDRLCQLMIDSPDNWWRHVLGAISNPFKNIAEEKERVYQELVSNLYNYHNLITLSDVILLHRGASYSVIQENHKSVNAFYSRALNETVEKKIAYLTNDNYEAYSQIKQLTKNEEEKFKEILVSIERCNEPIEITYTSEEIAKYLQYDK